MQGDFLKGKVILVISPQSWGNMFLAKHHYALELAKWGNEVYFLNPPNNHSWRISPNRIEIKESPEQKNLFLINQLLFFPYRFKFHARPFYDVLIRKQIRDILSAIGKQVDIVWSFDIGNLIPLKYFKKVPTRIFHPVDEPLNEQALKAGNGAQVVFSVTREILNKYNISGVPGFFINHGLPEEFVNVTRQTFKREGPLKVGFSGNLLRPDLDRQILLRIVKENPENDFYFYGSFSTDQSNIGAEESEAARGFIENLQILSNAKLMGVVRTEQLAAELIKMDALMICYDINLDQSRGTNYHKVMEYLSTGKVTISNNITTYKEYPDLIRMVQERTNNKFLPELFKKTMGNLDWWNSDELQTKRRQFALDNTYTKQLERIEAHLSRQFGKAGKRQ